MNIARAAAVLAAAGVMAALAACSPSLEQDSPLPPGTEPELSIEAPSSAAAAQPEGDACAIDDFTVTGEAGRQPKIAVPRDPCTAPETPLSDELAAGEGVAAKEGDTVAVNYVLVGVASGKTVSTWSSATESKPEEVEAGSGEQGWDEAVVGMKPGASKLVVFNADALPNAEQEGLQAGEAVAAVLARPAS